MAQYSLSTVSNLFKTKFGPLSQQTYNNATALLSKVKKSYNLVGDYEVRPIPNKFGGGVGSGSLPSPNASNVLKAEIRAKKVYAVVEVDRESIKASMEKEGAYVQLLKHAAQKGAESFARNMSRILFGSGDGLLGSVTATITGTASAPVCTITDATWNEANWEEGDFVNVGTDASVFEVTLVEPANKRITLSRLSGSLDITGTGDISIYMQNSKDNDPEGLKGVLDATSSTKYNVTIQRRFQAVQKNASAAAISEDLVNEVALEIERRTGKHIDLIVTSHKQLQKCMLIFDDLKRISLEPRDQALKGKIGFTALEYMTWGGKAVPIIADRFCDADRMYLLNTDHIEICHRPGGVEWFDDDGTVFLRKSGSDSYDARYGGYLQVFINPAFHGVITNLAVS
jgi:hypothetical protein